MRGDYFPVQDRKGFANQDRRLKPMVTAPGIYAALCGEPENEIVGGDLIGAVEAADGGFLAEGDGEGKTDIPKADDGDFAIHVEILLEEEDLYSDAG